MKHANYTVQKYKHLSPDWLWRKCLSPLGKVTLGLYEFTMGTGWLKSVFKGRPVNSAGEPLPWLSYPCIEMLEAVNLKDTNILEFGGGNSTLYFLRRGAIVTCIEEDPVWQAEIIKQCTIEELTRLTWSLPPLFPRHTIVHRYNLVLIDANPMYEHVQFALKHTSCPLLIDNLEIPQSEREHDMLELLEYHTRIDYVGFAPGNATQQCTSLFYDDEFGPPWLHVSRCKDTAISLTSQKFKSEL